MTTSTKTLQDMTPEEIDTILFPLWADRWYTAKRLQSARAHVVGTLFPGCRVKGETFARRPLLSYQFQSAADAIVELEQHLVDVETEMAVYEDEYDCRPWTRYVLCGARMGHLHYRGCSTLRWNTELLLIPQSSGLDSSEVVGKFGETACTKCFPGAPVAKKTLPVGVCEGSGTYEVDDVKGSLRLYRPYGRCRKCESIASVTSTGKVRQHKTPKES